jgi:hypothetical protein
MRFEAKCTCYFLTTKGFDMYGCVIWVESLLYNCKYINKTILLDFCVLKIKHYSCQLKIRPTFMEKRLISNFPA